MSRISTNARITIEDWISRILCALACSVLGFVLLTTVYGDGLTRFSFDFPFSFKAPKIRDDVVIVKLDDASHKKLGLSLMEPWPRELHADLLWNLKEAGARMVVFDIFFEDPGTIPEADELLAEAIHAQGNVVLCGDVYLVESSGAMPVKMSAPPYEFFRTNAVAWGVARMPEDADLGIRRQIHPEEEIVPLAWAAAESYGALAKKDRKDTIQRWINFYGPRDTIPAVSYFAALNYKEEVPPGFFQDKVVYIGQHFETGFSGALKDSFVTPYSGMNQGGGGMPGVEIQATAFLNLIHHEWLERLSPLLEKLLVLVVGVGCGLGLHFIRPWLAVLVGLGCGLLLYLAGWLAFAHSNLWFAWAIPMTQVGLATAWAAAINSARLYIDRRLLFQSLSSHLSKERARQIAKDPDALKPGGKSQQVSIIFSDIAGFSSISEMLSAEEIFHLLNQYYEAALAGVHQADGTVIQLIGDAIFAVWNAPINQANHQVSACRAALNLHKNLTNFDSGRQDIHLRTRVGVHTGVATVGNLGSKTRFEYTCIGDSVNLSSRLEGLNKHVGTDILATNEIIEPVKDLLVTRRVGYFRFKGFARAIEVHEILGELDIADMTRNWREEFALGLEAYRNGDFGTARSRFETTIQFREKSDIATRYRHASTNDPIDGPSSFYLEQIQKLDGRPLPEGWTGDIEMTEK